MFNSIIFVHFFRPKKTTDLESDLSDHEEEFYFTEVEVFPNNMTSTTPPVHPHKDMCRPPHEDPDYQKNRGFTVNRSYNNTPTANTPWSSISVSIFKITNSNRHFEITEDGKKFPKWPFKTLIHVSTASESLILLSCIWSCSHILFFLENLKSSCKIL